MRINIRFLSGAVVGLVAVASIAPVTIAAADLRLVEAAKHGDTEAVRTLLATRYAAARNDFAMAMGVSLFAVLLLLYVAVAAYLAILGSVRELSAGAASLALAMPALADITVQEAYARSAMASATAIAASTAKLATMLWKKIVVLNAPSSGSTSSS